MRRLYHRIFRSPRENSEYQSPPLQQKPTSLLLQQAVTQVENGVMSICPLEWETTIEESGNIPHRKSPLQTSIENLQTKWERNLREILNGRSRFCCCTVTGNDNVSVMSDLSASSITSVHDNRYKSKIM